MKKDETIRTAFGERLLPAVLTLVLLAVAWAVPAAAQPVPPYLDCQGKVLDPAGQPVVGPVDIEVGLFDAPTAGTELYHEAHIGVALVDGVYDLLIGTGAPVPGSPLFDAALFASPPLYLEVTINGEVLSPRQPVASTGYAMRAWEASHAGDADTLAGQPPATYDQSAHAARTDNPHGVTAAQVGADPAGAAATVQSNLDAHAANAAAHHPRYTDAEAVAAMGPVGAGNTLNHAKTTKFTELIGQIADSQIPASITRDSEIPPETDPQVGVNLLNRVPRWNGAALVSGSIFDNTVNVGIGTAAPESRLHILGGNWDLATGEGDFKVGDTTYRLKVGVATAGAAAGDVRVRAQGGTNRLMLGSGTKDLLTLQNGRVGIGTISPGSLLHVSSGAGVNGDAQVVIEANTDNSTPGAQPSLSLRQDGGRAFTTFGFETGGDDLRIAATNNNIASSFLSFFQPSDIVFYSSPRILAPFVGPKLPRPTRDPVERMRITGAGNVGIGTTAPESLLHVLGGNWDLATTEGDFKVGDTNYRLKVGVATSGGGAGDVRLRAQGGTNRLILGSGTQDVFTVQNGNVGIGTISPAVTLHVGRGTDASLVAGSGYQVVGSETALNLVIDNNEIIARNAGAASPLYLNKGSGLVVVPGIQITGGADLAEPFDVADAKPVKPGMVVSIDPDHPGKLRLANHAYDRMVAGIVSGANGIHPGLTMNQEGSAATGSHPVALTGRVYAWADTSAGGAIHPGDLLTTSEVPGHVMRVTDPSRATGAVIGKAMTGLTEAQGLVLVLVSLQ